MSQTVREFIRDPIFDGAGTSDASDSVVNSAVDLILTVAHVRRCRGR